MSMKIIIYNYEKMEKVKEIFKSITVTGISNIRMMSELADILDSGQVGSYEENKEEKDDGSRTPENESQGNME